MKPCHNLFLGTLVVIALSHAAQASIGTWSGTATATWDTSATNWTGVAGTPWDATNGPTNSATFNLASLAATVSGTVTTNGITFTLAGSLAGGVVTLAGTTPFIDVATGQTGTVGTTDLAGSAGLIKTGDGVLSLGSAKTLTGGVNVNAGTLRFTTGGGVGGNSINLGDTSGSTAATLEWVNNTTVTSGSPVSVRSGSAGIKTLQVTSAVSATISSLTLQDNVTKTNAGDLNVTNATNLDGASRTVTVNSGRLLLNGAVGETSGTGFGLTKSGAATLVLAGTNNYTGATTAAGGVLQVNKALALPDYTTAGKAVINGGTLSVQVGGAGWTTSDVNTLLANATKTSGNFGIDTTNAGLTQWTAFNDTNLSATIGLEKLGGNTLILNLANTYSGSTTVTGGTLQPNDLAALPGYTTAGKIIFNGGTINVPVGGASWATGDVDILLANATKTSGSLGIDTTSGNLTQWTPFTTTNFGSIGLTKNGTNTLTLDQANTFTGTVTVNSGVLRITNSGALGSGTKNITATTGLGRIELDGTAGNLSLPSSNVISISGVQSGGSLRNAAGDNTISGQLGAALGAGNGLIQVDGGSLNLSGTVRTVNSGGRTLEFRANSSGDNRTTGTMVDGTSALSVIKSGTGSWRFAPSNTQSAGYTGTVTVSAGTLIAQSNSALGSTTGATSVNGGTLDLGGTLGSGSLNLGTEIITISGTGVGGNGALVNNGSNDQTNAVQKLVLGANATVGGTKRWDVRGSGNTLDMAGFTLTKKGTNIVALVATTLSNQGNIDVVEGTFGFHTNGNLGGSASNTLTVRSGASADFYANAGTKPWTMVLEDGKVTTSSGTTSTWGGPGTLSGTTGGTFDISSGQAFTFNGNIGESAAGKQLIKSGAGTLTLAGANAFTGATTVNAGTLKLDYTTNDTSKLDNLSALTLAGTTLELAAGTHTEAVGSVNLGNGASSVIRNSGTAVLQMNAITPALGASINFGADNIASTDNTNTGGILGPWATVTAVGGTTWAANSTNLPDGLITGLTSYTLTSVAGNTGTNYAGANITIDSDQTLDAAATPNNLRFNNAATNTLTLQGANSVASGGILVTSTVGNNLSTLTGGTLTGPNNGNFVINQQNTANSLLISSQIINNGTTNLLKLGAGRAILTGSNSYSGVTTIAAGSLQIGDGATDGGIASSSAITNNGALVFNTASSHSYANVISGTGSLTKDGPGTCTLSGDNTYTGTTAVSGGTLTLSGNKSGNSGAITVSNVAGVNATLNIQNGAYALGGSNFSVGSAPTTPATGTVNQSGGAVTFTSGNGLLLGNSNIANTAIYNLSAGSITTASASASRGIILGTNTSAFSTFSLSGTGVLNMTAATGGTDTSMLQVGRFDSDAFGTTNTFNQTGGTANVAILSVGGNGATGDTLSSTINWTGGTFVANSFPRLAAGDANTATLTIGGTADVTLPAFPTARGTSSTATLYFDGGTLKPTATSAAYLGGLTNAFINGGGAKFNTNGFDITISQNLLAGTGSGGLTKEGTGTSFLTGANTYTGNTNITAGTLSLGNGTANTGLDNAADVVIAASATLNLNYTGTDTIDELTINGVQKSPGVWGSAASGAPNTDPQLTGTGTLTVSTGPSASDYNTWGLPYGLSEGSEGGDLDSDGLTNFQEYAFGLIPNSGASVNPFTQQLNKGTGTFKYTRRATPATTGVNYTYESSTTLSGAWSLITPSVPDASNSGTPNEEITVTVPSGLLTAPKLFIRVKATKP